MSLRNNQTFITYSRDATVHPPPETLIWAVTSSIICRLESGLRVKPSVFFDQKLVWLPIKAWILSPVVVVMFCSCSTTDNNEFNECMTVDDKEMLPSFYSECVWVYIFIFHLLTLNNSPKLMHVWKLVLHWTVFTTKSLFVSPLVIRQSSTFNLRRWSSQNNFF